MLDVSREERSFGQSIAEEGFTPQSRYTNLRRGLNIAMGKGLVADEKDPISEEAIRDELSRILGSSMFVQSDRLGRFLRFTVETTWQARRRR